MRRRIANTCVHICVLVYVWVLPLSAQAPDAASLAKIRAEGLQHSQAMETLSWLTDVYGGRLTNSPAASVAATWVEQRLGSWGIRKTWRENWGPFGRGWTNELVQVRAVTPQPFPIIANVEAWTAGTRGTVRGPVVFAPELSTTSDFSRYRGALRGAFVLVDSTPNIEPPPLQPLATRLSPQDLVIRTWPNPERRLRDSLTPPAKRSDGARGLAAFLKAEGALAMVNAGAGAGGTVFLGAFGERQGSPDPAQPVPLTTLTVASEHYGRIARILAKGIAVTLEADVRNKFTDGNDSAFNILAELPGTDKADEVVMLGAHFDSFHFATGATDNGVNVAVMLEVMRILKASNVPLRRTVRLALWTGEEQGSLGSRAYVARHFVDTVTHTRRPEFAKLAAYYNLDNGGGAIRGPMVDQREQLKTEADSTFRVWTRLLRDLGADIVSARGGGGSDHVSFYERGLPGFQFLQDGLDYDTRTHHTNMDTYERIVPEDVRRNAVIVASFVFLTANREKPFPAMRVW